jgi:hypothetical protein
MSSFSVVLQARENLHFLFVCIEHFLHKHVFDLNRLFCYIIICYK